MSKVLRWEVALIRRLVRRVSPAELRYLTVFQSLFRPLIGCVLVVGLGTMLLKAALEIHSGKPLSLLARVVPTQLSGLVILPVFFVLFEKRGAKWSSFWLVPVGLFACPWVFLDANTVEIGMAKVLSYSWQHLAVNDGMGPFLATCSFIALGVVDGFVRLLGRQAAKQRARGASHPGPRHARVGAVGQAAAPPRPFAPPGTAGSDRCRLTDFSRHQGCVYPLYGLILFAAWRVLDRVCFCRPRFNPGLLEDLAVTIGYAVLPTLYVLILRWPLRGESLRRVWTRLRKKHPSECPWCRYDVRGCTTRRCPECGRPTHPAIGHPSESSGRRVSGR